MLSRRQFLLGCAGTMAAVAASSVLPEPGVWQRIFDSVPVLLYHRVGLEKDDLTVSVEHFRRDMAFLQREGYNTLSLAQVRRRLQDKDAKLPDRPVMITFDDGYLDNYTNAFPILQQYGLTASFYIIAGMLQDAERISPAQIKEMQRAGMDFGSHTMTHRPLAELTQSEAVAELAHSRDELEQLLGQAVHFVAYPCGSYSEKTLELAAQSGYCGGFSTRSGFTTFSDQLAIRRIPIFHHDRPVSYVMLKKGFLPRILA
ncbi:polysaccharide deacetylase family protein [Azotosporobacter soli]|uniref:polysaccharide deacetylase family protein n=1 Tax=Azotosporobacter soli TaxID=3055040 RepID=UPI0031FE921C